LHARGGRLRLVLYLKNLEIYLPRDLRFSSFFSRFFVLCYTNLEKKNLEFFFSSFFGVNLKKKNCEVNLEFFLEIFISRFFYLSFTSTKSRDFLCTEFLELFSLPKNHIIYSLLYALSATMNIFDFEDMNGFLGSIKYTTKRYLDFWSGVDIQS
jgi:hypothetical protein